MIYLIVGCAEFEVICLEHHCCQIRDAGDGLGPTVGELVSWENGTVVSAKIILPEGIPEGRNRWVKFHERYPEGR